MDRSPPVLPLHVSRWFNTPRPITLGELRGKVVPIHAFQTLCPACVARSTATTGARPRRWPPPRVLT